MTWVESQCVFLIPCLHYRMDTTFPSGIGVISIVNGLPLLCEGPVECPKVCPVLLSR